ncbi:MAG: methyl-accepting chemotaxis protein [Lachnospiraceae bacterium]
MMSRAIENLHNEMSDIVGTIKTQGQHLADSSSKFGKTFADIAESVSNVDVAVEGIAEGSTSQAQETTSANQQVMEIGVAIEANADSVNVLNSSVEKMTELSTKSAEVLDELIRINRKTSANIIVVSEQTGKTNESAAKIKEALTMIQDIAEQTNLLSLNASIEAARAGEAGRGFAVVAEQIRKLSEDSTSSAAVIEDIVKELIENSEDSVEKMKQVTEDADIQHQRLGDTKVAFDDLGKEVKSVSYASKDIFEQTEKLEKLKSQVSLAVEQLAAISEENAAATEETSASMQTLSEAIDECKEETEILSELSDNLREQMEKFKF